MLRYDDFRFNIDGELIGSQHSGYTLLDFCEKFVICPLAVSGDRFYRFQFDGWKRRYVVKVYCWDDGRVIPVKDDSFEVDLLCKLDKRFFTEYDIWVGDYEDLQTKNGVMRAVKFVMEYRFSDGFSFKDDVYVDMRANLEDEIACNMLYHYKIVSFFGRENDELRLYAEENARKFCETYDVFDAARAAIAELAISGWSLRG